MAKGRILRSDIIQVNGVEVTVHRKAVKNLNMRVYPSSGKVNISAPYDFPLKEVENFILSKHQWIQKHLTSYRKTTRTTPAIVNGEKIPLWGKAYELQILERNIPPCFSVIDGSLLKMQVRPGTDSAKKAALLKEWYRTEMKREIPLLIKKWEPRMKVKVKEFGVKKMKTRWGTCNIREQRIWLNLELAKKSPQCLEYVVVHEMVHLLERLHSKRFYAFMDHFLPEWRVIKNRLNGRVD